VKGITYINRSIQYRIHATDRINKDHGIVIVDAELEEFNSRVTIFENGKVVVHSPHRTVEINLVEGDIACE